MSWMEPREMVSSTPSSCRGAGGPAITFRLGPSAELRTTVLARAFLWHAWGWFLSVQMLLHVQNSFLST